MDKDYILEGLIRMRDEYTPTLALEFEVDEKLIEINELIKNLEDNTEKGIKFRENVVDLIIAYMAKFHL